MFEVKPVRQLTVKTENTHGDHRDMVECWKIPKGEVTEISHIQQWKNGSVILFLPHHGGLASYRIECEWGDFEVDCDLYSRKYSDGTLIFRDSPTE